ncbi:MAG: DUF4142 domain-containing protein [Pseudomonadota bacterium]|nr:DUF4142 domain-containing protein [Pseudomonadota bacterium]
MSIGMSKTWVLALVLAAACQPAGEPPVDQPGVVPVQPGGARGTDGAVGDRAADGAAGDRAPGTNGSAPTERGTVPGTVPGTAPGTAQRPTTGIGQEATADVNQANAQALQDVHQLHQYQVELARLAKAKSKDAGILAYADQAAREYKEADDKLMKLAKDENISLETAEAARYQEYRDNEARLRALEGPVFDQAYIVEMVDGGTRSVKMVETVLTSTQDPEMKAYFLAIQPIVKGQADRAKQLKTTPRGTE